MNNFWQGFEKKANMVSNLISRGAQAVTQHAGSISKNLTTAAMGAKTNLGTRVLGAGAHVAGLAAKNPRAAMGIAAGGAALGGAAMLGGNNKGQQ